MSRLTLTVLASTALVAGAVACTPAEQQPEPTTETHTVVEKETIVPVPVETETPAPVVVEREAGDSTTVRADENGIEVETTNR